MFRRIEVQTGVPERWRYLPALLAVWAALVLLFSGASWQWGLPLLVPLFAAYRFSTRRLRRQHRAGRATLGVDGILRLDLDGREQLAAWTGHAWVCRWFCVVDWTSDDEPRRGQALVCAAGNHPDDFRRLRVLLRLGDMERAA